MQTSHVHSKDALRLVHVVVPAAVGGRPSALRVHDEGLKVQAELRHQRVHKILNGGLSL